MSTTVQEATESPWVPGDTFAARLVLIRRELRLNYREVAAKTGFSYTTWRSWERGVLPADMAGVVTKIADALGVDRDWLMWGGALRTPEFFQSESESPFRGAAAAA